MRILSFSSFLVVVSLCLNTAFFSESEASDGEQKAVPASTLTLPPIHSPNINPPEIVIRIRVNRNLSPPGFLSNNKEFENITPVPTKYPRLGIAAPSSSRKESNLFESLQYLAKRGNQSALWQIVDALDKGELGQDTQSGETRLKKIHAIALSGDSVPHQYAQRCFIKAWYEGELGLDKQPEKKRLKKIIQIMQSADSPEAMRQYAYMYYIDAMYNGTMGLHLQPPQKRWHEILRITQSESLPDKVREYSQIRMIDALFEGKLGCSLLSFNVRDGILKEIEASDSTPFAVKQHITKRFVVALCGGRFDCNSQIDALWNNSTSVFLHPSQ